MDSPELYEEIGRMKQRVDRQRAEIAVLKEKTRVLDQANMAMHEALAIANHQLETERAEKASMEKDVRARMEGMEEEIRKSFFIISAKSPLIERLRDTHGATEQSTADHQGPE